MDEIKKTYIKRLYGGGLIALGAFFLIEHVYSWGFDWNDFLGHEYLGIYLILIGSALGIWANKGAKKGK